MSEEIKIWSEELDPDYENSPHEYIGEISGKGYFSMESADSYSFTGAYSIYRVYEKEDDEYDVELARRRRSSSKGGGSFNHQDESFFKLITALQTSLAKEVEFLCSNATSPEKKDGNNQNGTSSAKKQNKAIGV